jgi:hypothetical protein
MGAVTVYSYESKCLGVREFNKCPRYATRDWLPNLRKVLLSAFYVYMDSERLRRDLQIKGFNPL